MHAQPDILVDRYQHGQPWSYDTNDIPQHGKHDHGGIAGQYKGSASRHPDRVRERIQCMETSICLLGVPAIRKH
jgi:hypothetical protein